MAEAPIAGGLAASMLGRLGQAGAVSSHPAPKPLTQLMNDDLPCPWCGADTEEGDACCPSCQQPFG